MGFWSSIWKKQTEEKMTPEIREYAREALHEAKLKVIKRAMEPVSPTDSNPFPSNAFHQWNEKVKKEKNYKDLVDHRFMGIITIDSPGFDQASLEEIH